LRAWREDLAAIVKNDRRSERQISAAEAFQVVDEIFLRARRLIKATEDCKGTGSTIWRLLWLRVSLK